MAQPFLTDQQILGQTPETAEIARQRKIADLLTSQAFNQPQGGMVSGYYVAPSITQQLQPLAAALGGSYLSKKTDEKAESLAKALRQKQVAEIEEYTRLQETDPGAALGFALSTNNPTLQSLAKEELKGVKLGEGEVFKRPKLGGGITEISGAPKQTSEQKEYELAKSQGFPGSFLDYQMQVKKAGAPSMTAITNVQAFEPFKSKAQGKMGDVLIQNFETLQNIPSAIKTLDRAAELAPKSFAGSFGEQKLELVKFFNNNLGTNINPTKVANTEELRSALFTNVMENLKKLDASPSQEQQRVLQQSMGSIATDPNALPKVINTYKQILIDKAEQHNKKVEQAEKGPAKMEFPFDIRVPVPSQAQKPTQQIDPRLFQYMTPEQRKLFGG